MRRRLVTSPFLALCAVVSAAFPHAALADGVTEARARKLQAQAMNQYLLVNVDLRSAEVALLHALVVCGANNCNRKLMAALNLDMGTVLATQLGRSGDAVTAFANALRLDPSIKPDLIFSNASIVAAFAKAQRQVASHP